MINWNKIKVGISNILWWFKVIWNDRQYDFEFIYVIELRKIQRMIKWSDIYLTIQLYLCIYVFNVVLDIYVFNSKEIFELIIVC